MDESWRMRMGTHAPKLPNYPPRRSTGNTSSHHRPTLSSDGHLNPEDFADVFGGPPRSILSRQFTRGIPRSPSSPSSAEFSYEDAFRRPEKSAAEVGGSGRKYPQFKIPFGKQRSFNLTSQRDGFYGDIFCWENNNNSNININKNIDDNGVARSRSKTSSSSVLSSEDLSPLRPAISDGGYDDLYLFGSKLRSINLPVRWNSDRGVPEKTQTNRESKSTNRNISEIDFFEYMKNRSLEPTRKTASPEPILPAGSFGNSAEGLKLNSPSSPALSSSSTCRPERVRTKTQDHESDDDDDVMMTSYVIEFDIGKGKWTCEEPNGVDEAIAWVKEKSQNHSSSYHEKSTREISSGLQLSNGQTEIFQALDTDKRDDKCAAEEETNKKLTDERIRMWSAGIQADIRLLLSSMHHILWADSGWAPLPLGNIIESSQVKKAYQKARLCLHPDKLQQRGATLAQKYVAQKVFSTLQDAWDAFLSGDRMGSVW